MKRFFGVLFAVVFVMALVLPMNAAYAVGTLAGTNIDNKATASYKLGVSTITKDSNVATIKVAEILNVNVTWQDAANVIVVSGDTNMNLLFKVTNAGNGPELFTLTGLSAALGGAFDPVLQNLYIDDGNGIWESGTDLAYNSGSKPSINPDSFIYVWVVNNIPITRTDGSAIMGGDLGKSQLTAKAVTITGASTAGTVYAGAGTDGTDAVVGTTTGTASVSGNYVASSVVVAVVKTALVINPTFGNEPVPGAIIEYTLTVQVTSGASTAEAMTITDPIPAGTTYIPGTIILNTVAKGDGTADGDGCDYNAGTKVITVLLGDMIAATPIQTIKFRVTVN